MILLNANMKHEQLTRDIIGAAMAVLNQLKPGLDEKLYENALIIELVARGHNVEAQRVDGRDKTMRLPDYMTRSPAVPCRCGPVVS